MPMRAEVISVSDVTTRHNPSWRRQEKIWRMMEIQTTPPPTTGNTHSRSHTSVKESDDYANDQIKAEAHLDFNGLSIEYENLETDTS